MSKENKNNNKNIIYVSCDTGKSNTKYAWFADNQLKRENILADSIRTVVNEVKHRDFIGDALLVEYNGVLYAVGGEEEYTLNHDNTKLGLAHELCVYTSIAQVLTKVDVDLTQVIQVDLSVNVPLADFKNIRQEYEKKYLNKSITLKVNQHLVKFTISNVRCFYEGQGAIIRNTDSDKGQYYVIDIGGKNDTHILFDDFKPVKDKNSMTNNGLLKCLQMVASDLSASGYEFTIKDVEDMLLGKRQRVSQLDDILNEYATTIVKRIRNQIQKFDPNLYFTTFIFTGGGSIILEKQLREEFKEGFNLAFAADARFDNCKGAIEKVITSE